MPYWTLVFLLLTIVAAAFGFTGLAGTATWTAQVLFAIFLSLFALSLLVVMTRGKRAANNSHFSAKGK